MTKAQVYLAVLGACFGFIIFLWIIWCIAPFLIAFFILIGIFMLIGYATEYMKSKDQDS